MSCPAEIGHQRVQRRIAEIVEQVPGSPGSSPGLARALPPAGAAAVTRAE